jgi:hypothetical protein
VTGDGFVTGDTIELEAVAGDLLIYKTGVLLRTIPDSAIAGSSSHKPGVVFSDPGGVAALDDWEGGNITGAGGTFGRIALQPFSLAGNGGGLAG